jgi:antitoxin component YwqK of YwqJK toxin-antitoxin module/CHAT domain-containing protein
MRSSAVLVWLFIFISTPGSSQLVLPPSPNAFDEKGLRTGHWTITYDTLWRETANEDSIYYYRLARFEAGRPAGKVRDFYRSGIKQWEGYLSSLRPEVFEDECLTFYENGRLRFRHHYRKGIAWGPAEEYYVSGQLSSKGDYSNDRKSGTWTFYFEDGKLAATVPYRDDLWNGPALFNHPNGSLDHRGNYVNEKSEGKHEYFSPEGVRTMTVHFRRDTLHGRAEFYDEKGMLKEAGMLLQGIKQGVWNTYFPNGKVSSTANYNGVSEGAWTFFHENGAVKSRGRTEHGKKQGVWENYYPDGTKELREGYRDDLRHGESTAFYSDGNLMRQAHYRNDSLDGDYAEYSEEKKIIAKGLYRGNRREGPWMLATSVGLPTEEGSYTAGLKNGLWKTYDDQGALSTVVTYRNDSLNGPFERYYPSGKIKEVGSYSHGLQSGEVVCYHENGTKELEGRYERGLRQGVWHYYNTAGVLQGEIGWKNEALSGPFTLFFPDGKPQATGQYDQGLSDGTFNYYYPDGRQKARGTFRQGKETGVWTYYDSLSLQKHTEVPFQQGKRHGVSMDYSAGKVVSRDYFVNGFQETYPAIRDSIDRLEAAGDYAQALALVPWMERVIKRDTKDWSAHALPSNYCFSINYALGYSDKCLRYALTNLKLHKKNHAEGTPGYGISVHNMAMAYASAGQLEKALPYFDEAIAIARRHGINESYWISVMEKVNELVDRGREQAAIELVQGLWSEAVEVFGPDSAATFPLEKRVGDFYFYKRSDYAEAGNWYRGLQQKIERRGLTNSLELFDCYRQLAYLADKVDKNYSEAVPLYEGAILLAERINRYTPDYDKLLMDYNDLCTGPLPDTATERGLYTRIIGRVGQTAYASTQAGLYQALGQYTFRIGDSGKAIDFQQRGRAVCEQKGLTQTLQYARLLRDYAKSLDAGEGASGEQVLDFYRSSVAIYRQRIERTDPEFFRALIDFGGLCVKYRQFDEATAVLQEALLVVSDSLAPDYQAKARMYFGDAYSYRFEYHLAIGFYEAAARYYETERSSHLKELESIYGSLASCFPEDFKKGLAAAENAMQAAVDQFGKDSPSRLHWLSRMGDLGVSNRLPSYARAQYQEAMDGYARLGMKDRWEYFSAVGKVIHSDVAIGDYTRGLDLAKRVIPEAEEALGKDHITTLGLVYEQSLAYEGLRDVENQELCLIRLVNAYRLQRDNLVGKLGCATYTLALGELYVSQNYLQEAESLLEDAVQTVRSTEWGGSSASESYITSLARLKEKIGKNAEAEKLYREAFGLAAADSVNDVSSYIMVGNNLASFYRSLGRNTEAEALLEELSAFHQRHRGINLDYVALRAGIIWLYYLRADEKVALAEANRLLEIAEAEGGVGQFTTLNIRNTIGVIQYDALRLNEARDQFHYCVDAMVRVKKRTLADDGALASFYGNLADAEIALGRTAEADRALQESISIQQRAKTVLNAVQLATLRQRQASLQQMKGEWVAAEQSWRTLLKDLMRYTEENFVFQSEEEKTRFWSSINVPIRKFRAFAIDRSKENPLVLGELYDLQLSTKGMLLASSNSIRKRMLGSRDSVMVSQYYHWMTLREQLGQRYAQPGSRPGEIDSLKRVINDLEKEMNVSAEDIKQDKGGPPITWRMVQSSLGPQEAAVEIVRYRYFNRHFRDSTVYIALVLTDQTKEAPALIVFPDGKLLEKQFFAAYKNAIAFQLADSLSYGRYWAPLEKVLDNRHTVYVSLDGVFHQLSLNSLRMPSGKYLADQNTLMLVSNTRDILALKNRKPSKRRSINAALFGFPTFYRGKEEDVKTATDRSGIYPLAGTKTEVDSIAAMLTNDHIRTRVYMGENASEEAIKQLRQPSIVHVATHGFFQAEGKPSAFKLSGVDEENPLNRTGLLLAGAANYALDHEFTGRENGILTAYEVSNLNLESAELVALSACETGKGVVQNGEGVYGLQRAFQTAGAKTILLSLWKVDDEATRQLMTKFYRYWLEGQTKAEALRRAQVATKARYPHPYYWAAFVLMEN